MLPQGAIGDAAANNSIILPALPICIYLILNKKGGSFRKPPWIGIFLVRA
jgi:hypothetical protein